MRANLNLKKRRRAVQHKHFALHLTSVSLVLGTIIWCAVIMALIVRYVILDKSRFKIVGPWVTLKVGELYLCLKFQLKDDILLTSEIHWNLAKIFQIISYADKAILPLNVAWKVRRFHVDEFRGHIFKIFFEIYSHNWASSWMYYLWALVKANTFMLSLKIFL